MQRLKRHGEVVTLSQPAASLSRSPPPGGYQQAGVCELSLSDRGEGGPDLRDLLRSPSEDEPIRTFSAFLWAHG